MAGNPEQSWTILRCSGRNTLALAEQLTGHGIPSWSPIATIRRRVPRKRALDEKQVPMMPTFVFAAASHINDLATLSHAPQGRCPQFSIFRYQNTFPVISDNELQSIRIAEERANLLAKSKTPLFANGQIVRVPEGSFAGMNGVVQSSAGGYTLVCFDGRITIKINSFLLTGIMANGVNDKRALRHRNAA